MHLTHTIAPAETVHGAIDEIAFAYTNVRFFRQHMDAAGLSPNDITNAADIARIPTTHKAHYRKSFPAGVLAKNQTLDAPFVYRSQSSGTGGERLVTVAHTYALADRMRKTISIHPGFLTFLATRVNRRTIRYAAPNCSDVECASPHTTMEDRILHEGTLVLPVHHDLMATRPAMVDQAIDEWLAYDPQFLYVDPTHLAFLIRHMRFRGVAAPPCDAVALTYTQCTSVARRQIKGFFPPSTPIADVISMSELGWVVMECPVGMHHINSAAYYPELLVGERPAEPGELAELVFTSLGDRICPHIRYRTGDFYRLVGRPCSCGHPYPIALHEGRPKDFLLRDSRVVMTPRIVDALVGAADWMDIYTMRQITDDHFLFRFVPNNRYEPSLSSALAARFRAELGRGVQIDIEPQTYLSCDRSGKFFSCLSDVAAVIPAATIISRSAR